MELHDALTDERAEKRKEEIKSLVEKEWASRYDKLYKQVSEEQANRFTDRVAKVDKKAREYLSDLVRWRQAYLATYVAWFAAGGSPEPQGRLTSMDAIEAAAHEFKVQLAIIENRVEKDAGHFYRPELLSFPKIISARIGAIRQNHRMIRCDACHPPSAWGDCRQPVQVAAAA